MGQPTTSVNGWIARYRAAMEHFFTHFQSASTEELAHIFQKSGGTIVLTGVGKSGYIAQKIAQSLTASGIAAFFLSPLDALHGDIGMVRTGATVLLLSKSGATDELVALIPFLRARQARIVACVCQEKSTLAQKAEHVIVLPLLEEVGLHGYTPTTSCVLQLIWGDIFSTFLQALSGACVEEFAKNHPYGQLGRRLCLRVADVMLPLTEVPILRPSATIEASLFCLTAGGQGCVLINGDGEIGIFTDGDLRRALQQAGATVLQATLDQWMTRAPKRASTAQNAYDCLKSMQEHQIGQLPVFDGKVLKGLVTLHQLVALGL